jgi:hypothetical protein
LTPNCADNQQEYGRTAIKAVQRAAARFQANDADVPA